MNAIIAYVVALSYSVVKENKQELSSMARFYIKHADTKNITSDLRVTDLKVMAKDGRLKQNDRIRKSGHTTWHLASTVNGLEFLEVDVTSVISLRDPDAQTRCPIHSDTSNAEIGFSDGAPQYGRLDSVYEYENVSDSPTENSTPSFKVRWVDNREDGPFSLQTIESLITDGFVQNDCTFQPEGGDTWNSIASLGIQSISNKFFVMWEDGRTDGPFNLSVIQTLVSDGFISCSCTFKHAEGEQVFPFTSMNLIDMHAESSQSRPTTTTQSAPNPSLATPASLTKAKKVKQEKQKKEREPWREGWLRRFFVKSIASVAILSIVIGLGCWGIWTALSDSQKIKVTKKYEEIKASMFGDDISTFENVSTTSSNSRDTSEIGQTSNNEQGSTGSSTTSSSINNSSGTMMNYGSIAVPESGPIWVQEELNLPVFGSYAFSAEGNSWNPMLFLVPPRKKLQGTLEVKAYYSAEQFGERNWFWVNSNRNFISRGSGNPDTAIPEMDEPSSVLLELGDLLGICNQSISHKSLVRSWFNLKNDHLGNYHLSYINNPKNYSAKVDSRIGENVKRVSLEGLNEWNKFKYLQFNRDSLGRVVSVVCFDKSGSNSQEILKFEYAPDNSVRKFSTVILKNNNPIWTDWIPSYQSSKLISIASTNLERKISVIYNYDSRGRISQITYSSIKEEPISNRRNINMLAIDKHELIFSATFAYESYREYWSTATLKGNATTTKIRGLENSPEVENIDFGTVKYEQTLSN